MYFYIFILCLNTMTSMINTNVFFDFLELVRNKVRASIGTTPLPTTTTTDTTDNNEVVVPFALRMPPTLLTTMLTTPTTPTTPLPDHLTHDDDDEERSVNSGLESGWSGDLGGDSMDLSPMGPPGPPLGFSYVKSLLYMLVVLVV
jgi:hypothetical protein